MNELPLSVPVILETSQGFVGSHIHSETCRKPYNGNKKCRILFPKSSDVMTGTPSVLLEDNPDRNQR